MNRQIALNRLNSFVGQWKTEGKILPRDSRPEIKVSGTDTYEWLPGNFFLLHKVSVSIGDERNETTEIIGFDQQSGNFTMQHYDNKGNSGFMTATCDEDRWIFTGDSLKFTGGFHKGEHAFSGTWEQLTDGKWSHFMEIHLIKQVD